MSLPTDKQARKERPIFSGVMNYFPEAIAEVAYVSFKGSQQHHPDAPMHWDRAKSKDQEDCISRHLLERGTIDTDGVRHSAKLAWRALALLQIELEAAQPETKLPTEVFERYQRDARLHKELAEELDYEYEQARKIQNDLAAEAAKYGDLDRNVIYISGPMRKIPENNFPAFDAAKDFLLSMGFGVISPADMDRIDDPAVEYTQEYYANRDTAAIQKADGVAVLNGWEHSHGATAEVFYARWIGKFIIDAETGVRLRKFNAAAIEDGMRRWLGVKA